MSRVKAKVIDKIREVRSNLRKYDAYLTVEAAPDTVILADAKWGPITVILHLRLKPGEEGKNAWYAVHMDVNTAIRLICSLARAVSHVLPSISPTEVLKEAARWIYEKKYAKK